MDVECRWFVSYIKVATTSDANGVLTFGWSLFQRRKIVQKGLNEIRLFLGLLEERVTQQLFSGRSSSTEGI
jgi:hypothetical protein